MLANGPIIVGGGCEPDNGASVAENMMSVLKLCRLIWRVTRHELTKKPRRARSASPLDAHVRALRRDGLCVIPNFIGAAACDQLRGELDRLLVHHRAAIHLTSNGADQRLLGVELVSESIRHRFHASEDLLAIAGGAMSRDAAVAFTIGNVIRFKPGNIGSGNGWHRDSLHVHQLKAILYLTDASAKSGAFEYVLGSHRLWRKLLDGVISGASFSSLRIRNSVADRLLAAAPHRHRLVEAPAGTLIITDTTGMHRGRPLMHGERYALTAYIHQEREVSPALFRHFAPVIGRSPDGEPVGAEEVRLAA